MHDFWSELSRSNDRNRTYDKSFGLSATAYRSIIFRSSGARHRDPVYSRAARIRGLGGSDRARKARGIKDVRWIAINRKLLTRRLPEMAVAGGARAAEAPKEVSVSRNASRHIERISLTRTLLSVAMTLDDIQTSSHQNPALLKKEKGEKQTDE